MKVYDLIKELAQHDADTEVIFHVYAKLDVDVEAEFDRNNEDDVQEVTVSADIDENFDYDGIYDNENSRYNKNVTINLIY